MSTQCSTFNVVAIIYNWTDVQNVLMLDLVTLKQGILCKHDYCCIAVHNMFRVFIIQAGRLIMILHIRQPGAVIKFVSGVVWFVCLAAGILSWFCCP